MRRLSEDYTFKELLDAAAERVRGKQMAEDEWEHHRALWAGLGVTLAPCAPPGTAPVDITTTSEEDDAFDRAMKGFE